MSRVGARREREGVVPRAGRAGGRSLPSPIATDASGCRGYLVCRAGFAGRDTPLAQAIERYNSLSGPDPRCISGRPPASLSLAAAVPVHEIAVVALLVVVPYAVAARPVPIVHEYVVYTVRVPRCGMRII